MWSSSSVYVNDIYSKNSEAIYSEVQLYVVQEGIRMWLERGYGGTNLCNHKNVKY